MNISEFKNSIIRQLKDALKSNGSPESIAMGFSLGTLIAILPTPGFGIFVALFIALFFNSINKVAIVASFTIWNPLVVAPLYWLSYLLGDLFFTPDPTVQFDFAFFDQLYHYSGAFMIGNAILALLFSIASYFLIQFLVTGYARKQTSIALLSVKVDQHEKTRP